MTRMGYTLLVLGVLLWAGGARAQLAPPPPTKTITIVNNSAHVMYAVIQAPIQFGKNVHDLWMQAQLGVKEADYLNRPFLTTKLYRAWINHGNGGIPPGGSVTITVPFYTQLHPWTQANSGKVQDQFVDWWNAMRVYVFEGKDATDAAYNYSQDNPPQGQPVKPVLPPYPITPMTGAAVPTCTSGCALDLRSYFIGFPNGIPAQLVEYTFAAAEGPPNQSTFSIDLAKVNYNISAVDSIYLPMAIGAKGNNTAANTYLGSVQNVQAFQTALNEYTLQGGLWPAFVPAYFLPSNSIIAVPSPNGPPRGITTYPQPQVPSANFMYAESYRVPAPAPPTLTSDGDPPWVTKRTHGQLGDVGQGTLDLWNKCTTGGGTSKTCTQIQAIRDFFVADYKVCFGAPPRLNDPNVLHAFVRDVYGWVQFEGCAGSLANTLPAQYPAAIKTFCDLMYNFFTVTDDSEVFDPYVKLVHVTLASNAYAFSIDDEQAFKSLPGTGVIVTIAGANGLENKTQTELPTAANYNKFCESAP
jgi:hypothetical protein